MTIEEALSSIKKKLRGGATYNRNEPIEKVEVHQRTHSVIDEYVIDYEVWGGAPNGGLDVPLHVYVSKHGVLARTSGSNTNGPEVMLTWEQLDAMRKELGA